MSDERYDIDFNVNRTGSGGQETLSELDQVKAKVAEVDATMRQIRQPDKIVDTDQFKIYAAGARDLGASADESSVRLATMREALAGVNAAAHGSAVGLARSIEGIGKIIGLSKDAQAALSGLTQQLGAAGVGLGIGTSIGAAIYQNIITPIWDAHDAYEKLHDPIDAAYQKQKDLNREILALRSLKLREVVAEIDGVTTALKESAKQAEATKKVLSDLSQAESRLEEAKVRNAQAAGRISDTEAKQYLANISYMEDMNSLLGHLAEAKQKLAEIGASKGTGSTEYRDQSAVVAKTNAEISTTQTNRNTNQLELGGEAKALIENLSAEIKAQEAAVERAREAVAPAGRSGDNSALQTAIGDVSQQEQILAKLKADFARIQSTMGESITTFTTTVGDRVEAAKSKMSEAGSEVKTTVDAAAASAHEDMKNGAKVFTEAVGGASGIISGAVSQSGQDIANAFSSFAGRVTSQIATIAQSMNSRLASIDAGVKAANDKGDLALSQIRNDR